MIESPIRRKTTHYPRDFAPVRAPKTAQPLRYTRNAQQHPDISQQHRLTEVEEAKPASAESRQISARAINPEKLVVGSKELQQEDPLTQHDAPRPHNLDADLLKRPRFSVREGEEIPEEQHETLGSPIGIIRHQHDSRQTPLPLEGTCRIEHFQRSKQGRLPDSVILFKSSSNVEGRKWVSSEKEVIESFRESRMRRSSVKELPVVSKTHIPEANGHAHAHEIYNSFRMRQKKGQMANMGKVNNLLLSLKEKDEPVVASVLPRFKPSSTVERLRDEVNYIARHNKKQPNDYVEQYHEAQKRHESEEEQEHQQVVQNVKPRKQKKVRGPQFVVSYRSSLAQLKDIYSRIKHLQDYKITVKVPKLFTEELLTREQDKNQLYETAETIFSQLRLPHDNIVVKRYTNCVTATCRNIGMVWSFEGRRYLGGWQSEYLDEGFKHGVGLEWEPRKYVYYGEFARNRREGLGVLKDSSEDVSVGYWRKGRMVAVESESERGDSDSEEDVMYD